MSTYSIGMVMNVQDDDGNSFTESAEKSVLRPSHKMRTWVIGTRRREDIVLFLFT